VEEKLLSVVVKVVDEGPEGSVDVSGGSVSVGGSSVVVEVVGGVVVGMLTTSIL